MATATQRDFYDILGVARDASTEDIRKAYLKLAHKYHPDKTGGDKAAEDKLKEINGAYDTLKNPEKRKQYDQMASGPAFHGFEEGAAPGGWSGGFDFSGDPSAFEDILGAFFSGGAHGGKQVRAGNDLEAAVSITLQEASTGTTRKLKLSRWELCPECEGTGRAPGSKAETCVECHGTGHRRSVKGTLSLSRTCPRCHGTGQTITRPCARCAGHGRMHASRELAVTIPAGAATGMRLRLAGEGEAGEQGGPRGDLYILVTVEPHPVFTRDGDDLVCEAPVTVAQAALGTKLRVPTLTGMAELRVPEGTQHGTPLRMRGLGMPRLGASGKGDQIVRIAIEVPTGLSPKQRELLSAFDAASEPTNYPRRRRFLHQAKSGA